MEFRVGDKVRCIEKGRDGLEEGNIYTIIGIDVHGDVSLGELVTNPWRERRFIKAGGHMTKHQIIKGKIESWYQKAQGKGGGWDKELGDIMQEISAPYNLLIPTFVIYNNYKGYIYIIGYGKSSIYSRGSRTSEHEFHFSSQCGKLTALRDAVLWLLDNSDIPKSLVGKTAEVEVDGQKYEAKLLKVID